MKQIIFSIAISGLFTMTACNNTALTQKEALIREHQHIIDSMNTELAKKHVIDSMNEYTRFQFTNPPVIATEAQVVNATPKIVYVTKNSRRGYSGRSPRTSRVYNRPLAQAPVYQQQRKRGWSAKATGAVVGAGTGGLAGALINGRNRTAGAVIGTLLGAGAGLGVGAIIDKRNGR